MASLEQRNEIYRIVFRFGGEKFSRSLKTKSKAAAELALAQIKDGLHRLKSGLLELAPGDDIVTTLLSAGRVRSVAKAKKASCLGRLLDEFLESIPANAIEKNTRGMLKTHIKHLKRLIGTRTSAAEIDLSKLQGYVNLRSREPGIRGNTVSAVTIRKELTTLNAAWKWAKESLLVSFDLPRIARVRFPKRREKPPFKTWDEITRLIRKGKLSGAEQRDQWDCLFLNEREIVELLRDVSAKQTPPAIQIMFFTAAYTGMRRSELLRSQLEDIDLESGKLTIREKKRVRGQHSTRTVPVCSVLRRKLVKWLAMHPGGTSTFSLDGFAITHDMAHDHFVRTIQRSKKFSIASGWHMLRHSFISNCVSKGLDQRIIDDWVGHTTEEMRRRYRHLLPNVQQAAIESVFG